MHRIMARETGMGVKQKGLTVSVGCVAIGKCQSVKWLGKGTVGRMQETQGQQDRTRDQLGMARGTRRVQFAKLRAYLGSNSLAMCLALLHSSPSMKASIASRVRSTFR